MDALPALRSRDFIAYVARRSSVGERVTLRDQLGLTGFCIGIPLLLAWAKVRLWDFLARH